MSLSTHILDTSQGRPAPGVAVRLDRYDGTTWENAAEGVTDEDGRLKDLPADRGGTYRLRFGIGPYFHGNTFFPEIQVIFVVADPADHYHVPLLVSPYSYSTYRGS
ncbi:MAG: hydroxyisourate hydrolase [Streptosporangiaceae bacterium]